MQPVLRIDIVSDVMCPWCAVGFYSLQQALTALEDNLQADIHWQPFELNPSMAAAGQNMREHLMEKYGISAEQSLANRTMITERGQAVGFEFNFSDDMRMYNTFKAHQLLHWAESQGKQTELKQALFQAHFKDHVNVSQNEKLVEIAASVGLDAATAAAVLNDERYAALVRAKQQHWQEQGIHSVPAFIINEKYLVSGGQPPEAFVQVLTQALHADK